MLNRTKISSLRTLSNNLGSLTKFKLSVMNASMVLLGYSFISLEFIPASLIFSSSLATSCALQSIGQIKEKHIDSQMKRTSNRQFILNKFDESLILKSSIFVLAASGGFNLYYFGLPSFFIINCSIPICYLTYLHLKTKHKSNYFFGSLSGALPFLGGWLAADNVCLDSLIFSSSTLWLPLFVTVYMWYWQKIHFAFIIKRYQSDYQKINYQFAKSLTNFRKLKNSIWFFVLMNGSVILFLLYPLFSQSEYTYDILHLTQVQGGIVISVAYYWLVYKYTHILKEVLSLNKEHLSVEHNLNKFRKIKLLNYKLIFYFYIGMFLLNKIYLSHKINR